MKMKTRQGGFSVPSLGRVSGTALITLPATVALAFTMASPGAHAAAAAQAPALLEEVVVTAQRREETAQKTALAITALSSDALAEQGVTSTDELNNVVPNLKISTGGQVTIRGITSSNGTEVGNPAVSMNLDGVYLARSRSAVQSLYDVERVEVLRGPQGTLYGRNAIAGGINIVSKKPSDKLEAAAGIEFGSYELVRYDGMLNLPFSDSLAVRAAFQTEKRDGYTNNTAADVPGGSVSAIDLNNADSSAARIHVLYKPVDSLSILISGDLTKSVNVAGIGPAYSIDPTNAFYNQNKRTFAVSKTPFNTSRNSGISTNVNWNLGAVNLTYVGAHRADVVHGISASASSATCNAATGAGCGSNTSFSKEHSTSHELRLANNGERLKWVTGLFYFKEHNNVLLALGPPPNTLAFLQPDTNETSKAAFAEATVAATSTMRFTGGLRYTKDQKSRYGGTYTSGLIVGETYTCAGGLNTLVSAGGCLVNPNIADYGWTSTDWKAGVEYDVTPTALLYFNIASGYKAGGYTDGFPPNNQPYDPEHLRSYEVGSKNRFLNNTLQSNLTAYLYDYTDFQVSGLAEVNGQNSLVTINAGGARNYGLEWENIWAFTEQDRVTFNMTYTHARYTNFRLKGDQDHPRNGTNTGCTKATDVFPYCADYTGNVLASVPTVTATLTYQHTWDMANGATLTPRVQMRYEGSQNLNYHNYAMTEMDAYTRSEASLTYAAPDRSWTSSAYVKNIEDKDVFAGINGNLTGTGSATYQAPRTFGVTASVRF